MFSKRWAQVVVLATFGLITLGGLVHARGASLACPDWPLCYGMVFPPMQGGILLEHSHRLLGAGVGLGVIMMLASGWSTQALRRPLFAGLALVIGQGVLGGLTVLFRLPPPISIAHLGTSMIFFAWAIRMTQRLGERVEARPALPSVDGQGVQALRSKLVVVLGLLYAQLVLGAAVRHTHASLSCGTEVFSCQGDILPSTGPQVLQSIHRVMAVAVMAAIIALTLPVLRWAKAHHAAGLRRLIVLSHAVVTLQLVMGALTLSTGIHTHVVVTHLALGALLWGLLIAAWGQLVSLQEPLRVSAVPRGVPLTPAF